MTATFNLRLSRASELSSADGSERSTNASSSGVHCESKRNLAQDFPEGSSLGETSTTVTGSSRLATWLSISSLTLAASYATSGSEVRTFTDRVKRPPQKANTSSSWLG